MPRAVDYKVGQLEGIQRFEGGSELEWRFIKERECRFGTNRTSSYSSEDKAQLISRVIQVQSHRSGDVEFSICCIELMRGVSCSAA